jgi:hypothetical protein
MHENVDKNEKKSYPVGVKTYVLPVKIIFSPGLISRDYPFDTFLDNFAVDLAAISRWA